MVPNKMLATDLALYVLSLDDAAGSTVQSDDRPLYQVFRAHAGYLLALAVLDADAERLNEALDAHDGLWVETMLVDEACKEPAEAWQRVRENI